jgi:hypothetical protein
MKKLLVLLVLAIALVAYYHYFYAPRKASSKGATAYILPDRADVVDTTAEIRRVLVTLHSGQPVIVLGNYGKWAQVALGHGIDGWIHTQDLLSAQNYDEGRAVLRHVFEGQAQAAAHMNAVSNVHLTPSRAAMTVARFTADKSVEVYNRQVVARSGAPAGDGPDVWYLVQSGQQAGWVLGDFVTLDIPPGLALYAQGINLVAWLPLDTVDDGGQQVPQFVAADRIADPDVDFNHIRVFTWWVKHHKYVTAFVKSGLAGYFPITVTHEGGVPYFRLRLIDDQGHRVQQVYGLFDTITRPVGVVDGWTTMAMPPPKKKRVP